MLREDFKDWYHKGRELATHLRIKKLSNKRSQMQTKKQTN